MDKTRAFEARFGGSNPSEGTTCASALWRDRIKPPCGGFFLALGTLTENTQKFSDHAERACAILSKVRLHRWYSSEEGFERRSQFFQQENLMSRCPGQNFSTEKF
jgi:hypothetical protein